MLISPAIADAPANHRIRIEPGELGQVIPSPKHFEPAAQLVTKEITCGSAVAGPDASKHIEPARTYLDAG